MNIVLISKNINHLDYWSNIVSNYRKLNNFDINKIGLYDTVILDFTVFPNISELFFAIQLIKEQHGKVIVLHNKPDFKTMVTLLKYKINGYGNIYMDKVHVLSAIQMAEDNKVWLYPEFVSKMITMLDSDEDLLNDRLSILTTREKDLAILITKGFSNKDISQHLNISLSTVKVHLSKIFTKFDVKDRFSLSKILQ